MQDLNLRPPACEAGALPTELIVRVGKSTGLQHSRQPRTRETADLAARNRLPGVYGLRRHVDAGSFIAYVTTLAIRSGVGGIFFGGFRDSGAGDDAGLGMEGAY